MRGKALKARKDKLAELAAKDAQKRCASCKIALPDHPVVAADQRQFCSMECFWDAEERLERLQ